MLPSKMECEHMDSHILKEMATNLEEAGLLVPVLDPDLAIHRVVECMKKSWEDRMAVVWNYKDVLEMAHLKSEYTDGKEWMTKEEAVEILYKLSRNHDATIGVNWTVILDEAMRKKSELGSEEISKRQGATNES